MEGPQGRRAGDGVLALAVRAPGGRAGTSSARRWRASTSAPAFDIHGGGVDLRFPHHENEQAQSRAAGDPFASYWLHNAWITTSGEKMSKSLGNSLLVPNVLEQVRGIELRFYMVSAHYRSTVEFSFEALHEAAAGFRRIESFLDAGDRAARRGARSRRCPAPSSSAAMDDDLGTPAAVAVRARRGPRGQQAAAGDDAVALRGDRGRRCAAMLDVLGVDPYDPAWPTTGARRGSPTAVDALVARPARGACPGRAPTRTGRRADAIRDRLKAAGVEIEDTPDGPKWSV